MFQKRSDLFLVLMFFKQIQYCSFSWLETVWDYYRKEESLKPFLIDQPRLTGCNYRIHHRHKKCIILKLTSEFSLSYACISAAILKIPFIYMQTQRVRKAISFKAWCLLVAVNCSCTQILFADIE